MNYQRISFILLGILPLSFIVLLLTFYIMASVQVGHWPAYDNPEPSQIRSYSYLYPVIQMSMLIWLASIIAWIVSMVWCLISYIFRKTALPAGPFLFCATSQIVAPIFFFLTGEWFLD